MFPRTRPVYAQLAAAHAHLHVGVEQTARSSDGDRGAGAGAAGERLAGAALVNAQADAGAVGDLHKSDVHALREAPMMLDGRPQALDRCRSDTADAEHGVWVAYAYGPDLDLLSIDLEEVDLGLAWRLKR
jgi:hypothetical protein